MSNEIGPLHIAICDDGYRLSTRSGDASYTLNGIPTLKVGIVDNLPDKLTITDRRSLPSALNVSAASALWGAKVEWEWPKEADESWHASIRASWVNGEDATQQGKPVNYPETAYTITGVPSGIDIAASITLHNGNGRRSQPAEVSTKSSDDAAKILGTFIINNDALVRNGNYYSVGFKVGVETEICRAADEHAPVNLEDCKNRFADKEPMPFGGFPMPKRKVRINIAGLHQWKSGIISGAEVRVYIIQNGKCIHSEVFSGKATKPFIREIEISASFDDIVAVHNRPDLNELKVSAEFADVKRDEESDFERLKKIINDHIRQRLNKELQPGGLLHKR